MCGAVWLRCDSPVTRVTCVRPVTRMTCVRPVTRMTCVRPVTRVACVRQLHKRGQFTLRRRRGRELPGAEDFLCPPEGPDSPLPSPEVSAGPVSRTRRSDALALSVADQQPLTDIWLPHGAGGSAYQTVNISDRGQMW